MQAMFEYADSLVDVSIPLTRSLNFTVMQAESLLRLSFSLYDGCVEIVKQ